MVKRVLEHESAPRKVMAEHHNLKYKAFKTFEEAKQSDNSYLIMEGDYGGQIYLTIPVKLIKCDLDILENLLKELDGLAWKEYKATQMFFEEKKVGGPVLGGMGGGIALDRLWVHKDLEHIKERIYDVLIGKRKSLGLLKIKFLANIFKLKKVKLHQKTY